MALTNMAVTAAERKEKEKHWNKPCSSMGGDKYPYGLTVNLEEESLDKLGLNTLPQAGDTMTLTAKVKVRSVESRDSDDGKRRSVSLQITSMELEGGSAKEAVDKALKGV